MPKVKTMTESAPSHVEDRRKFISEAFHCFHQPLTVLHCGLELSLLKQRTEDEYRQRLGDALLTAGTVLQLNKAVRELVEASDPGEDLSRVELKAMLTNMAEELSYTAEAGLVAIRMECPEKTIVAADAGKLACHLGNLASLLIRSADPGGSVHIKVHRDEAMVLLKMTLEGNRREPGEVDLNHKLDQIRLDAACSYIWAIGGEFRKAKKGYTIGLTALS